MDKILLIIKREYIAKVRNKSFVIMTFLSPILMVGMVILIGYLATLNDNDKKVIAVLNESDYFNNDFLSTEISGYVNFRNISLSQAKDSTKNVGYFGLLYIPQKASVFEVAAHSVLFTKEPPSTGDVLPIERIFESQVKTEKLNGLGITKEQFSVVNSSFELQTATFTGEQNLKGINELKAILGGAFGYLIMMFIVIYGGFVMRSVIEEKTSRIIEVIVSSVKPFHLMLGKIIGTSLAGVTQFIIWIISAGVLLLVATLFFDIELGSGVVTSSALPVDLSNTSNMVPNSAVITSYIAEFLEIPWVALLSLFLVYFILGYLIYSSIYAAIGAAVDNETDTQQFMLPIIMPLVLGIYVGFFSVFNNPHGPIAVGFSLFPLTSPIVMLMRLPSGIGGSGVAYWQLALSISLLVVTFLGIVWLAAKIYRIGILTYGKRPTYKELWKWIRY